MMDFGLATACKECRRMEIDTEYASRLFFPRSAFPQIYFEAIANAFDAGASDITIHIVEGGIDTDELELVIKDNGEGFTDTRFDHFARLQEPVDPYHKGLGRLVYLQYFEQVSIQSYYDGKKRSFVFSADFDGTANTSDATLATERGTTLRFTGFLKDRLRAYDDIRPEVLKDRILDQFLPLLHDKRKKNEDFLINIKLELTEPKPQVQLFRSDVTITPADVPSFSEKEITVSDPGLFDDHYHISMSYFIAPSGSRARLLIAASVDRRSVPITLISEDALPAGYSATFLFESDLFTGQSDSARKTLQFPEDISVETVYRALREAIGEVLSTELPEIESRNRETREHFEGRYPHLSGLFEDNTVGIIARDEALESAQRRFFQKQKEVLEADSLDDRTFKQSLELSARTLAEYILYRELTIKKLKQISADDPERVAHNLIVPRFEAFEVTEFGEDIYRNNAWILDDKFMSFRTVLSEGELKDVIQAITLEEEKRDVAGRPDISMIFSADPEDDRPVDVVVVEVKARRVDDRENTYVLSQLVRRAEKLVDYCPNIERMWYFGIIEIDHGFARLLKSQRWKPLFSRGEHLYYQEMPVQRSDGEEVPTPMYLLSYDAIIEDAAARNHTFLEILKSEIRRAAGTSGTSHRPQRDR